MQSTHGLPVLPAIFLLLLAPLGAQTRYRVTTDGEWFHQEANGRRLARLARGAVVGGNETQGDWIRVTMEGWIWGESVGATPRAGFDLAVTRSPEENLRSSAAGALVAKLQEGFLLTKIADAGRWVRVQRSGWVLRTGVEELAGSLASGSDTGTGVLPPGRRPGVSPPETSAAPLDSGRAKPIRQTQLYRAPEGPEAGTVGPETPLRVLGRSGEWTRVQVEGWVKTAELESAPPGVLIGVSAAELRAEPARYAGKVVQWTLQYVSRQTADDLRPDIPRGMTYLLTRGPVPERGFVYVVVAEGRLSQVETLSPLTTVRVTARVRAGRSRFLGNPVVDLLTLEVVQ
ncbi:MAG TPA: hypothetical protein VF978_01535 [Gemmatimonadales bacterium]